MTCFLPATTMMMKLFAAVTACMSGQVWAHMALDLVLGVASLRISIFCFYQILDSGQCLYSTACALQDSSVDRVFSFVSSEVIGHTVACD